MTRERLQRLSFASLLDMATKEGIKVPEGIDKESLIDQIQEALEEDRDEREQSNNAAMRIKEKKYEIVQDEEIEAQEKADYPLPERYNETRIVALLRDPLWAFAYWDLKDSDIDPLSQSPDFKELFLRVCEVLPDPATGPDGPGYFDIPVKVSDDSWYINLPNPGKSYFIELRCATGIKEILLCRSNEIHSPLGEVAPDYLQEVIGGGENDVLALSGLDEYGPSSVREQIPQRINSLVDDDYLEIQG